MLIRLVAALTLGLVGCNTARTATPTPVEKPEVAGSGGARGAVTMDATLTVAVQTAKGVPVKGVHLRIFSGTGQPERGTSDERGEVRFEGAGGTLQITIDDPAHPPTVTHAVLASGDSQRVVITTSDASRFTGTVVDGAGKPIVGAEIEILAWGMVLPPPTTTDRNGTFASMLTAGTWRMKVSKPGKADTWTTLEILPGQATAALTITVPDSASLVVTTDCNSKGCAKAAVNVLVANSGYTQYLDATGSSTFKGLPLGDAVVTVRHDADHRRPLLGDVRVALVSGAATSASIVMAAIEATASIAGAIVDRDGKPVRARPGGQLVIDVMFRGLQRRVIAASDGVFTVPDLIPGECTLTGLQIDPADSMSGRNGMRSVTKAVAPAKDVQVTLNDFFRR